MWICYLLGSGGSTYVGVTKTLTQRIRQHNGEIKGGASATHRKKNWQLLCYVKGFENRSVVQKFETQVKRYRRKSGGRGGAIQGARAMWVNFNGCPKVQNYQFFFSPYFEDIAPDLITELMAAMEPE